MDKPSDKTLRLLQEKIWNKYVCAEEGKYVLNENLELRNKISQIVLTNARIEDPFKHLTVS